MIGAGIRSLRTRSRRKALAFDAHRHAFAHEVSRLEHTAHRRLTSPEAFILAFVAGLTVESLSPAERRVEQVHSEDDTAEQESRLRATLRRMLRVAAIMLARRAVRRIASG